MMEIRPKDVRNYVTPDGREPYEEWVNSLRNRKTRAIIRERMNRLHLGNWGDLRRLTGDLIELRIHYGPGYRVYVGDLDGVMVRMLCGGSAELPALEAPQEDAKAGASKSKRILGRIQESKR